MIMNNIKIAKKKPIEIEVIQITGTDENIKEIKKFCAGSLFEEFHRLYDIYYRIETLEGDVNCEVGDWIAKGVENEMYPIRNSIFEKTHDIIK
jgi:hypothetical protein